jgi:hypothetical protein
MKMRPRISKRAVEPLIIIIRRRRRRRRHYQLSQLGNGRTYATAATSSGNPRYLSFVNIKIRALNTRVLQMPRHILTVGYIA